MYMPDCQTATCGNLFKNVHINFKWEFEYSALLVFLKFSVNGFVSTVLEAQWFLSVG